MLILTPGGCFLQMHLQVRAGHAQLYTLDSTPLQRTFIELEQECGAMYYQTEEKGGIKRYLHAKANSLENKTKQRALKFTGNDSPENDALFTNS